MSHEDIFWLNESDSGVFSFGRYFWLPYVFINIENDWKQKGCSTGIVCQRRPISTSSRKYVCAFAGYMYLAAWDIEKVSLLFENVYFISLYSFPCSYPLFWHDVTKIQNTSYLSSWDFIFIMKKSSWKLLLIQISLPMGSWFRDRLRLKFSQAF